MLSVWIGKVIGGLFGRTSRACWQTAKTDPLTDRASCVLWPAMSLALLLSASLPTRPSGQSPQSGATKAVMCGGTACPPGAVCPPSHPQRIPLQDCHATARVRCFSHQSCAGARYDHRRGLPNSQSIPLQPFQPFLPRSAATNSPHSSATRSEPPPLPGLVRQANNRGSRTRLALSAHSLPARGGRGCCSRPQPSPRPQPPAP